MRTLAVIVLQSAACLAQVSTSIALNNGVHLRIETSLGAPTEQQVLKSDLAKSSGNSFYRIFRDQNGLTVYAYELTVDRPSGDDFRIVAKPAGDSFAARFPNADGGKPAPTLSAPRELPVAHSGDRVPFEVFELPGGGKVVDTIELTVDVAKTAAQSGDRLRFAGIKVSINRAAAGAATSHLGVTGKYAMFYLPGRGGYFFSTDAPAGRSFVQAGWIDGARMQFTLDNETYDCSADAPILIGSDRGEIWVYHDASYKPQGNWTNPLGEPARRAPEFFTAASDILNWWLP